MTGALTDVEESACLVLLDLHEEHSRPRVIQFAHAIREIHPGTSALDISTLWTKFMGMDGRVLPTHDFRTGNRL